MIQLKTEQEIAVMREGAQKLARVHKEVSAMVKPGITTAELDHAAEVLIEKDGGKVAFRDYNGFPGVICVSVNNQVVHTAPSDYVLKEGDIITLDLGLVWKGWYSDMARTLPVGKVSDETAHLIETTKKSLRLAVKKARVGNTIGDIGNTVQRFVEGQGYNLVRELCGHGIGRGLHEDPQVLNYGDRHTGEELKEGMVICIEPMVIMGGDAVKRAKDGQTFITKDGSLAAHFEDTIAVTADGAEVLTK